MLHAEIPNYIPAGNYDFDVIATELYSGLLRYDTFKDPHWNDPNILIRIVIDGASP